MKDRLINRIQRFILKRTLANILKPTLAYMRALLLGIFPSSMKVSLLNNTKASSLERLRAFTLRAISASGKKVGPLLTQDCTVVNSKARLLNSMKELTPDILITLIREYF